MSQHLRKWINRINPQFDMSNASHRSSTAPSVTSHVNVSSIAHPQPTQAERTADARKAFLNSLGVASSEVDAELKSRAKTIYANEEAVSNQDLELQKQTKQLAKENGDAEKWLGKIKQKLAEFDNWAHLTEDLEDDLEDLEAMLDMMEQQDKQGEAGNQGKAI